MALVPGLLWYGLCSETCRAVSPSPPHLTPQDNETLRSPVLRRPLALVDENPHGVSVAARGGGRSTRVAVVDDDPETLQLVCSYLDELGCETLGFAQSHDLEAALDRHKIDLVLLDVMMPGRSGREVLSRLRARFSPEELPIIMTTALGKPASIVDCLRLGANDYLVKPLDLAVLAARVSSHLRILDLARGRAAEQAEGAGPSSAAAHLRICPRCGHCYQFEMNVCPDDQHELQDAPFPVPLRVADRYRLVRRAGQGAMGCVFQAFDERLERTVALKVLRPERSRDAELRARFEREATASSRLEDPGIARVYDYGQTAQGELFIVMEWLNGMDLATALTTQGPGGVGQVVRLLAQAGRAIDCAHRAGLVHRDIKPANIFIEQTNAGWQTRLLDFGVARELQRDSALTLTGELVGTPMYMAPEQLLFATADGRSDLYALAVSGYEALTGHLPRSLDRRTGLADPAGPDSKAVSLRKYRPELSEEFDTAFLTALAWNPVDRPESALRWTKRLVEALPTCPASGPHWSLDGTLQRADMVSHVRLSNGEARTGVAKRSGAATTRNGAPSLRVLAVDDDAETLELLSDQLKREGFDVVTCATADEALESATRETYDVVLSDVHLHGMSGIDLCARLTRSNPALPVIVITAFGDRRTELKAEAAGARGFIHKPVELSALCETLKRAVGATDVSEI